jgi:hypothetical protein
VPRGPWGPRGLVRGIGRSGAGGAERRRVRVPPLKACARPSPDSIASAFIGLAVATLFTTRPSGDSFIILRSRVHVA